MTNEEAEHHLEELNKENTLLRAALARSKDPCVYCQLPADEMAKCRDGFPGCGRMDDLMGCPELGAMQQLHKIRKLLAAYNETRTHIREELGKLL